MSHAASLFVAGDGAAGYARRSRRQQGGFTGVEDQGAPTSCHSTWCFMNTEEIRTEVFCG